MINTPQDQGLTAKEKRSAANRAKYAVRVGVLQRTECEICGSTENLAGHHENYSRPLQVRWLCSKCHSYLHNRLRRRGTSFDPDDLQSEVSALDPRTVEAAKIACHRLFVRLVNILREGVRGVPLKSLVEVGQEVGMRKSRMYEFMAFDKALSVPAESLVIAFDRARTADKTATLAAVRAFFNSQGISSEDGQPLAKQRESGNGPAGSASQAGS